MVHEAKKYRWLGSELSSLIQDGNLGLLQAAKQFDPGFGTQFSTYAIFWIRQAIWRGLAKSSLPIYV